MSADPTPGTGHDARIIALIGTGHFLSHFYVLCLPPLFLLWRDEFGASYAELGLAVALMSGTTALLQTPVGFWVDKHGARPFLVGGTLLMALSISAMAAAPGIWAIWALAILSGIGNSVIHPADYAILAGSIDKSRMGRAFALHTFTGNLGFALAPPVIALLAGMMGWRSALLLVGLLGVPVVAAILVQSRILNDQPKPRKTGDEPTGREILLSRPILLFFGFFLLSAMAGSGIQAFVITVLGKLWGTPVAVASMVLTGYMVGATGGTLVGGWIVDRTKRNLIGFVVVLTFFAMGMILALGLLPLPEFVLPRHGRFPHAARRDAEGCRPAGPDRQGVRLRLLRPAARRGHHPGAARPAARHGVPGTGAAGGGGAARAVAALRRVRPGGGTQPPGRHGAGGVRGASSGGRCPPEPTRQRLKALGTLDWAWAGHRESATVPASAFGRAGRIRR